MFIYLFVVFQDVRNESNEGVKHFLCRAIGHLAEKRGERIRTMPSHVYYYSDSWPELHRFINMNVTSNDVSIRKTILELIGWIIYRFQLLISITFQNLEFSSGRMVYTEGSHS